VILVDTSIWIDHFRAGDPLLAELLNDRRVLAHPFVAGELACGNLKNRASILSLFRQMPAAPLASDEEVLFFIEHHALIGRGIGYIDAHLLAATSLAGTARLWTRDTQLNAVAESLNLAFRTG